MSLNVVIVEGRLVRDPELRFIANERAVCNFSIAVNERWTKDGEKKERVSFIDCEAWQKTGELVAQYLMKGSACTVQGKLQQETWDQDGTKRSRIKVVADHVHFGPKREGGEAVAPAAAARPATTGGGSTGADDGEPPFLSLATGDQP